MWKNLLNFYRTLFRLQRSIFCFSCVTTKNKNKTIKNLKQKQNNKQTEQSKILKKLCDQNMKQTNKQSNQKS